jgi:hypothetical protein
MIKDCCEGVGIPLKKNSKVSSNVRNFASLTEAEQQAFAEFILKEQGRHQEDIDNIQADLDYIKIQFGIVPTGIFVSRFIECRSK